MWLERVGATDDIERSFTPSFNRFTDVHTELAHAEFAAPSARFDADGCKASGFRLIQQNSPRKSQSRGEPAVRQPLQRFELRRAVFCQSPVKETALRAANPK